MLDPASVIQMEVIFRPMSIKIYMLQFFRPEVHPNFLSLAGPSGRISGIIW